jgi:hypothetical protein
MKEAVGHFRTVVVREHARAADAQGVGENRNRDSRADENQRAPEAIALNSTQQSAAANTAATAPVSVIILRTREVCEDDRQRQQRHQRPDAAASFHHLKFLSLACAPRHQLDDVALPEHGNVKHTHRPHGAARSENL